MIPQGLCQCGCGGKTGINRQTVAARGIKRGEARRFIPGHNRRKHPMMGSDNPRWNGGRRTDANYIYVIARAHGNANSSGYVAEHVLAATVALGRALPAGAMVHHVNEDTMDNRPQNLVICENQGYHMLLHQRARALRTCGHADWLKCRYCKKYDDPTHMHIERPGHARHSRCLTEYDRRRRKGAHLPDGEPMDTPNPPTGDAP